MADFGSIAVILAALRKAINSRRQDIQLVVLDDLLGRYTQRIFTRGLASNGRGIGQYSTKPMLVGAKSFITNDGRNKAFSKRNIKQSKWRTVRTAKGNRALLELKGGYKAFRKLNGRQNSKVDLEFTSDLRNSIQVGTNGGDLVLGFIEDKQRIIAEAQQERFKKDIFGLSRSEEIALDKAVIREIDAIARKIFR